MDSETQSIKIGELFIRAGIISDEQLSQRLNVARSRRLPLGRALLESGDLTSYQLLGTVQVQSLILDGLLGVDPAVASIRLMHKQDLGYEEALRQVGFSQENVHTCKLGELLVEAEVIRQVDLFSALAVSFETCMPLGVSLVERHVATEQEIEYALELQKNVRVRRMSREDAVSRLKEKFGKSLMPAAVVRTDTPTSAIPVRPLSETQAGKGKLEDLRVRAQQAYTMGKYPEAERFYAAALKEAERLGEKDRDFLRSHEQMASFYMKRGESTVAKSLLERAVIVGTKFLAPEDPLLVELKEKLNQLIPGGKITGSGS